MESSGFDAKMLKEIMERKLQEKDLRGAIHLARRVQNLYPQLKRLFQFLGNIVVPVSIEDEEIDWYTVLGVHPTVDCKTMKQHYVELVRVVTEAESYEAYKILDKAWLTLSNIYERKAYDMRRRSRVMQLNALIAINVTSARQNVAQSSAATEVSSKQAISPYSNSQVSYASQPSHALWGDKMNIKVGVDNVSRVSGSALPLVSSATPLMQPTCVNLKRTYEDGDQTSTTHVKAPCIYSAESRIGVPSVAGFLGNKDAKLKEKMSIGENVYAPLPSTASWSSKMTIQPGMENVLGMYANVDPSRVYKEGDQTYATKIKAPSSYCRELGIGLPSVAGSDGANITKLKEQMGLAENTFSTPQQPNAVWSDKINVQPGMHGVSRDYTSPLASVLPATLSIQPVSVNSKKAYADGDLTLATKVMKTSCIDSRESRIGLPHVAGSIGINNVEHDGVKMSSVGKVHGSSIIVPHNHVDAESGVKQMGNTQAEKVGISGSSKGNRNKRRRSGEETSFLVKMARTEIRKKLEEWNAAAREKNECNAAGQDKNESNAAHNVENVTANVPGEVEFKTMEVPDSDFHDFDKERMQKSFGVKQVWAAYDEDDGMPRLYALIREVSRRPFKLQISWLNAAKSNMDVHTVNWIDSGFHKTCGDFWVGKKGVNCMLNSFSHRVTGCTKASRVYQIYPKKGDVWALYRNWSHRWNSDTTEEEKHKYDVIEVLEDYTEENGVKIVPLGKVAGFKSVFTQHSDPKEVRTIPKEEIFRFSHQVSSYVLTDQEAPNVPKGSRELDPAALPLELLQVIN